MRKCVCMFTGIWAHVNVGYVQVHVCMYGGQRLIQVCFLDSAFLDFYLLYWDRVFTLNSKNDSSEFIGIRGRHWSSLISVTVINTDQKQLREGKSLFVLHFQVTIHHWVKSRREPCRSLLAGSLCSLTHPLAYAQLVFFYNLPPLA